MSDSKSRTSGTAANSVLTRSPSKHAHIIVIIPNLNIPWQSLHQKLPNLPTNFPMVLLRSQAQQSPPHILRNIFSVNLHQTQKALVPQNRQSALLVFHV